MVSEVSVRSRRAIGCAFLVGFIVAGTHVPASAQTTVTLNEPGSEVVFATLRAGSYERENLPAILATRASDNPEYLRRALLKFDTENAIPAGSEVTSAILTVTIKSGGDDGSRRIGLYPVVSSWTETEVTWRDRRSAQAWKAPGGDLGARIGEKRVGRAAGTKVSFDVTPLVQDVVGGESGDSRYTRVALIDLEPSTSDSYREYYTPTDSHTAYRPSLVVTYQRASSGGGSTLRVLHWNTHHGGVGSDGNLDPDRLMTWAASFKPDIVSMNEVERRTSWGDTDGPAQLASLMERKTGKQWYYVFTTGTGNATGNGNLILSRFPFDATDVRLLSHDRAAVNATIHVNGRTINFISTHLEDESSGQRRQQIGELTAWAATLSQQRIIAGDFNANDKSREHEAMTESYRDSWEVAEQADTAISDPGNPNGNTRNGRIDYIFYSTGASGLTLTSAQVPDTRDDDGTMPSDHRPLLSIFRVK